MKLMFMCCNQCLSTMKTSNWKALGEDCTCIFLEEAPTDLNGHTVAIYLDAVEQDRLFMQDLTKDMSPEELEKFCFENGFVVPTKTNKQADALQDGECPCCHGNWPGPDAVKCNGCGYTLDEPEGE